MTNSTITPFTINIPQTDIDDLKARLKRTRWTNELAGVGDAYGVELSPVQRLVQLWQESYDWKTVEAQLNRYPQFLTEIEGQQIHFVHVRSTVENAVPLILLHGWPMTFVEFTNLIERLTNPLAHGGKAENAFHVIIPSLPGIGFSGITHEQGWSRFRIARVFAELMRRLGYERYGIYGNDMGALIAPELGRLDREHVLGVHVTQLFSFPSGDPEELARLSEEDMQKVRFLQWFKENKNAYDALQSSTPQTLAHALADSPSGQLAWMYQLFGESVSDDYILTNASIYWFTNTIASSMRLYYENRHATDVPTEPTTTPTGLANFAWDFQSIRPLAERDHSQIIHWNTYQTGGHNASQMTPDLLIEDMRAFFEKVR